MAKARSPNREKAFDLYKESGGTKPLVEIAAELNVSDSQIRKWKNQDKWDDQLKGNVTNPKSNATNQKSQGQVTLINKTIENLEDADLRETASFFTTLNRLMLPCRL